MNAVQIRTLVDRGLEIRDKMTTLKKELDAIEVKLRAAGLDGQHEELKDADREGRRFLAIGSEYILPIVFTADKILGTFKANSEHHKRIAQAAGRRLQDFYLPVTTWEMIAKDGKTFRTNADAILGKEAPAFITACLARDKDGLPKSDIKLEWGSVEKVEKLKS